MTIYCFHEIGFQSNPYCIGPGEFEMFVKEHRNDEFHFDDGRSGVLEYALPLVKKYKLNATVFPVPIFILGNAPASEQYSEFLTVDNIKTLLKSGFKLGSHTMSHRSLIDISDFELFDELYNSKEWLYRMFKVSVTKLSLPYNHVDDRVFRAAKKCYEQVYALESLYGIQRELILKR